MRHYLREEEQPEKITINRVIGALTDPNKALNFPVKYPALDISPDVKTVLLGTAGILAIGLIASALIKKGK
jgi:hypothetical protein